MINKIVQTMAEAMAGVRDGAVILVGGFGSIGQPNALIEGLIEQGAKDLTVVANNSGVGYVGLAKLLDTGRVRKIVCSFPRTADPVVFERLWREGKIELECVPQGTMAERMRAAGAGIPAFYTPTAVGTKLAAGKEEREIHGRKYILEEALHGDVALVEAWEADRWGNLTYKSSARNFNPVMATAAKLDHRAEPAHRRARRARSGKDRDAGNFRRPGAARALRRTDGDIRSERREEAMNAIQTLAAKPMARREMAKRLADDIPEGWYVNLGIGAPLQVADYVPQEREVVFQSENGIARHGPGA